MPCDSSYMDATPFEIKMSRILLCLDELREGKTVDPDSPEWRGYDKRAYGGGHGSKDLGNIEQEFLDAASEVDIISYSLEVQTMVRDLVKLRGKKHQKKIEEQHKRDVRSRAIGKLTPEEREVLGIEDNFER